MVTTLAGTASSRGSTDGTGSNARFSLPRSTAVDAAGNVYVVDGGNQTVRQITPAGVVTTLAGAPGCVGLHGRHGHRGAVLGPASVAIDSAGNLYLTDSGNHTIRKIAPGGVVTTLAGTVGSLGSTDATGTAALFSAPTGVAVDAAGNIYVSDTGNETIRKITPAGVVTTLAGSAGAAGSVDSAGTAAQFSSPTSIAVDGAGNIYVADEGNDTIRKVATSGVVTTLAGSAGARGHLDATGTAAQFDGPNGVAADSSGNVYVADTNNETIRKISPSGAVTTFVGITGSIGYSDGAGTGARFNRPLGMSFDAQGNLYVADSANNTIRKITPAGVVSTLAGSAFVGSTGSIDGPAITARFNEPNGVAVDSGGNIYVGDTFNATVRKITPDGTVNTLAGSPGAQGSTDGQGDAALFFLPYGVITDAAGDVLVADAFNSTIRKVAPDGTVTTLAGAAGVKGALDGTGSDAAFQQPLSVAVDPSGNIFVADTANNLIRKVTSDGVVSTFAGLAGFSGSTDGVGSFARFNGPAAVAVDAAGNVYVADRGNNTIRRVATDLTVTTVAGFPGSAGAQDGTGNAAWFNSPSSLVLDGAGNIFVADTGNNTIRRVTPAGVVTTVAGMPGISGSTDGTGSGAQFSQPGAIAVDRAGNLYVADTINNTIRKGTPAPGGTGTGSNSTSSSASTGGTGSTGDSSGSGSGGSSSSSGSSGGTGSSSTSSGSGSSASASGAAAQFLYPVAVAKDGSGNLFVADASNDVIREITAAGVVSTLAGTAGVAGLQDGSGSAALFNQPNGVAVDGAGNVYVADTGNGVIRKITAAGTVSTLAGSSANRGNVDGTGGSAAFSHPLGLTVDGSGNLYVADAFTDTIRKVTPPVRSRPWRARHPRPARPTAPAPRRVSIIRRGVAVDSAGNVYVADTYNDTIRKITSGRRGQHPRRDRPASAVRTTAPALPPVQPAGGLALDSAGNSMWPTPATRHPPRHPGRRGDARSRACRAVAGLEDATGTGALFNQPQGAWSSIPAAISMWPTRAMRPSARSPPPGWSPRFRSVSVQQSTRRARPARRTCPPPPGR